MMRVLRLRSGTVTSGTESCGPVVLALVGYHTWVRSRPQLSFSDTPDHADEIRRVEALGVELEDARSLLAGLEERTRELRTAWLKYHAKSAPPLNSQ